MKITEMLKVNTRAEWRSWLAKNCATSKEIWLVTDKRKASFNYLDSVEEALCFGWIDGIAKKLDNNQSAQRFTPRRKKSHWTELNKERARRLIEQGLMTEAGRVILPNLSPESFILPKDIETALKADTETWQNFQRFPSLYKRIRIGYIEETRRKPEVFEARLNNFLKKTKLNKMFGKMK